MTAMTSVIETSGLVKNFGRTTALAGLDLEVSQGEVHGFLGPNGAGKSTTLRILLGLLRCDGGRAKLLGGGDRLVMTVAVRRDGSVEEVLLNRPSGLGVLDQAAIRIVRLAEPFPPLPETAENIDVLHITRTWQFMPGGELVDQ